MTRATSTQASRVLLSGAGQLGSRYLQGLAKCLIPLDIYVHDVQPAALAVAEQRWHEVVTAETLHGVTFHTTIQELPRQFDVAIIATTAQVRPQLIGDIAAHSAVQYWILEKVLAQSDAGLDDILAKTANCTKAWVNTPRRMLPWHKEIKAHLARTQPMVMKVDGGLWGLACNSIHFLDLFAWWTGTTLEAINTDRLADKWIESKRAGNWEVLGTITARFSGGETITLHAQQGEVVYTFELTDPPHVWHMIEQAGTSSRSDGLKISGRIPFQSELSGALIESILKDGECGLPSLAESVDIHRVFIRSMLQHWRRTMDADASSIPIT